MCNLGTKLVPIFLSRLDQSSFSRLYHKLDRSRHLTFVIRLNINIKYTCMIFVRGGDKKIPKKFPKEGGEGEKSKNVLI